MRPEKRRAGRAIRKHQRMMRAFARAFSGANMRKTIRAFNRLGRAAVDAEAIIRADWAGGIMSVIGYPHRHMNRERDDAKREHD